MKCIYYLTLNQLFYNPIEATIKLYLSMFNLINQYLIGILCI